MTGILIIIAILAFCVLAIFILTGSNTDLSERLRKANARADYLTDEREQHLDAIEQLTFDLRQNDHMRIKQARKSNAQQERIAELGRINADRLRVIECLTADSLNVVPISRARATGDGVRL